MEVIDNGLKRLKEKGVFVLSKAEKSLKLTHTTKLKIALLCNNLSIRGASELIGVSYTVLNDKVLNRRDFKASEIYRLAELLGLNRSEVVDIFLKGYGEKA